MFHIPTRIIYGNNAIGKGSHYIPSLGKKALIVSGKSSARLSGALDDICKELSKLQIGYAIFDKVEQNPTYESVMQGATFCRENHCDFVIGIGGGSPIDAAKAISLTVANNLSLEQITTPSLFKSKLPLIAIPTTAGTGTEATPYSVLTDTVKQRKAGFGSELAFPDVSLVDPAYTLSTPKVTTLNTGIDALSHLLEGIYSNKRNPLLYPVIFYGIKLIIDNLPPLLDNLSDLSLREAMLRASLYGGIAIAHTSTSLQHSIGYPLTSKFGVAHGLANGIVMQDIMELYYPAIKQEMDELFRYLGMSKQDFYNWLDAFDLPVDFRLDEAFIEAHIQEVLTSRNMANNPFEVSPEAIKALYRRLIK